MARGWYKEKSHEDAVHRVLWAHVYYTFCDLRQPLQQLLLSPKNLKVKYLTFT